MACSKRGTRAIVTVPTTKANATSILDVISATGLINASSRAPKRINKRKLGRITDGYSTGTVTGHYLSFLKFTLDEMDKYPEMKGHYVVDNAPIHSSVDIEKYIHSRGYRYVYLPPYSPELNPIEKFWSVIRSKVKQSKFLEKELLMTRISEARSSLYEVPQQRKIAICGICIIRATCTNASFTLLLSITGDEDQRISVDHDDPIITEVLNSSKALKTQKAYAQPNFEVSLMGIDGVLLTSSYQS
ncbi:conserved hypothetical protein [Mucor ambiguus]|uniref:Tc1-like transposase DDE domain-containing protein n=1 Tax=Mucor ambiguus TaxID=91626 RepID=A0A0C9MWG1_9FUNG|nr:conserved hypothetical protein [Mucor ambiguus]